MCLGGRATQIQTLDALRDDRPAEEVEEEEAWKALREGQAVNIAFSLLGFVFCIEFSVRNEIGSPKE